MAAWVHAQPPYPTYTDCSSTCIISVYRRCWDDTRRNRNRTLGTDCQSDNLGCCFHGCVWGSTWGVGLRHRPTRPRRLSCRQSRHPSAAPTILLPRSRLTLNSATGPPRRRSSDNDALCSIQTVFKVSYSREATNSIHFRGDGGIHYRALAISIINAYSMTGQALSARLTAVRLPGATSERITRG